MFGGGGPNDAVETSALCRRVNVCGTRPFFPEPKKKIPMSTFVHHLIEALRQELQQYGEMLALLEQQQGSRRGTEEVLRSISAINTQMEVIQSVREQSQAARRRLAENLEQPADCSFSRLIPLVPEPYRVLVDALVRENQELLARVRDQAEQNQALLGRSLHSMRHFITAFAPENVGATPSTLPALAAQPDATPETVTVQSMNDFLPC